jgi:hypothetical protein
MGPLRDYARRWLRWEKGRQNTGYDKLLIAVNPFVIPFDCYLLRFPDGTEIPPHRDPIRAGRHYRINIILKRTPSGGEFICAHPIFQSSRINVFRSDTSTHSVSRVVGGTRYVLSIGWVLRDRVDERA